MNNWMKTRDWIISLSLLILALAAILGMALTYDPIPLPEAQQTRGKPKPVPVVDETPLKTAQTLAAVASTAPEQELDHQAQKVADHEVDLAFSDALRSAASQAPPLTPETKELFARQSRADAAVKRDQDLIAQLTKQLASASDKQKDAIQDQIDVAKAQLELDQDEQDDASEDIQRAGADPQAKIKKLLDSHEATHGSNAPIQLVPVDYQATNLIGQWRAWSALKSHQAQLAQAQQAAIQKADRLAAHHQALEQQIETEKSNRDTAKQQAIGFAQQGNGDAQASKQAASVALSSLRHFSDDQRTLADFDKRIQDEQQLAEIYGSWQAIVMVQQHNALYGILRSALLIILIVLVLYLLDVALNRFIEENNRERTRLHTLRVVIRFALQAVAILLIAFVLFGAPNQTPTVLGLAGAGLTVAMKDFIVAFFGWFVLMGSNGMRVGDWVEIQGVAGEVIEINLLRTILLETGNWTETGHPTGRKVAFVNSFAIEGHFFNFSTVGQWMWDELEITVPAAQDPYSMIEPIQKMVNHETAENVEAAEQEWTHATTRYRLHAASAAPAVNLHPTGSGTEVHVRYITRASERSQTRSKLYKTLVEMLHQQEQNTPSSETAK